MLGELKGKEYVVTTTTNPDWYSQVILLEINNKVYEITNGGFNKILFEGFYKSFKINN